jgi:hypothetical protein
MIVRPNDPGNDLVAVNTVKNEHVRAALGSNATGVPQHHGSSRSSSSKTGTDRVVSVPPIPNAELKLSR